jgi:hypothetical protein
MQMKQGFKCESDRIIFLHLDEDYADWLDTRFSSAQLKPTGVSHLLHFTH